MDEAQSGLIELVLVFGAVLAWAGWEVLRNRRELARLKRERGSKGETLRAPESA